MKLKLLYSKKLWFLSFVSFPFCLRRFKNFQAKGLKSGLFWSGFFHHFPFAGSKLLYWPIASKVTFVPHGLAISLLLFIEHHQVYFRLGAWGPEMSFWMVGSLGCVQLSISSGAPLTPYTMHHHLSPGETIDMCVYISHHVILACSKCMGWAHVQSAHMHFVFSISFFPINKLNWYWLLP